MREGFWARSEKITYKDRAVLALSFCANKDITVMIYTVFLNKMLKIGPPMGVVTEIGLCYNFQ